MTTCTHCGEEVDVTAMHCREFRNCWSWCIGTPPKNSKVYHEQCAIELRTENDKEQSD